MRKLLAVVLLASAGSGCTYASARIRDLGDIGRLEVSVGVGLQAHANVGEVLQVGVGSSRRWAAGWQYGQGTAEERIEDHLPLALVRSWTAPETEALHSIEFGPPEDRVRRRDFMIVPGEVYRGDVERPGPLYYNLEVGLMAGVLGIEAGFSLGEFADFVFGFFGADISGDDDEVRRAQRKLWIRRESVDRHLR